MTAAPGGQRGVLEAALAWQRAGRAFALVLVAATGGSTYRKPGAFAVVAADGERRGTLSGGCLEPAVEALGRDAIEHGRAATLRLDTRGDDDLLFGSGSGCRGWMDVVACPVPGVGEAWLQALADGARRGNPVRLFLPAPDDRPVDVAAPPRLLLVGAGPEAPALLAFAHGLGWWTMVCEPRAALREGGRLALADHVDARRPAAALADADLRVDAAVVMSHQASTDLEALSALAHRDFAYLGLLGPPARRDELLDLLAPDVRAALAGVLHAPVGLPIGGEGREAIALSVVAQVQQVLGRPR